MKRLFIFCGGFNYRLALNVAACCTNTYSISEVIFVCTDSEGQRVSFEREISRLLENMSQEVQEEYYQSFMQANRCYRYDSLDSAFTSIRQEPTISDDYFDVTSLPKENMLYCVARLLGYGCKNVHVLQSKNGKRDLYHEVERDEYRLKSLYGVGEFFLDFVSYRQLKPVGFMFLACALLAVALTGSIYYYEGSEILDLMVGFFGLLGGFMTIGLSLQYVTRPLIAKRRVS